jgi:glucose uptake protein GlcU
MSGLAAGVGLGAAEAPTKLVTIGLSPFMVSLGMVAGVFVARWTVPIVLKGSDYVWADLREEPHLVIWALLAGMLWAVANTLTVFAIRDVGLSVAFPLWNTNSLVGLFWGWLLFNELRSAGTAARPVLFWLFLGGFCWVIGDLFQQYAAKYIGIRRGIPLSNTNQLWGLAWGALVFGEFAGLGETGRVMLIAGSLIMIGGATAINFAVAPKGERESWRAAMARECRRYGLDTGRVAAAVAGDDPLSHRRAGRR